MKKRDTDLLFWVGIELVSLLSITFILIMFLALANAAASVVPVSSLGQIGISLPSAVTTIPATEESKGLLVTVNSSDEIYVGTTQVKISNIPSLLTSYISQYGTPTSVKIAADKSVSYGTIVQIMDLLRQNGISTIDLIVGQAR
ncbi:MAG: biopolymer transporter ExbD [Thermotogae bacterium]|nr:biopolymer transporter ExbD [Thermotogota bacterium]MCL5032228.1 biopolymer transporter ExbD [Thermotogota bacterium]